MLAEYAATWRSPRLAATDAITTMRPCPDSIIEGSTRRMHRNGAVRLLSSICCHCSSVVSTTGAATAVPALATRVVAGPQVSSTRREDAQHLAGVRQVGRDAERLRGDLGGDLLELGVVATDQHDPMAGGRQAVGDGSSDALAGSGDDGDPSIPSLTALSMRASDRR